MNMGFNGMIITHSAIFFESSIHDELEFAENNTRPPLVTFILVSNSGGATQNIKTFLVFQFSEPTRIRSILTTAREYEIHLNGLFFFK